jgi:hypothetical protein
LPIALSVTIFLVVMKLVSLVCALWLSAGWAADRQVTYAVYLSSIADKGARLNAGEVQLLETQMREHLAQLGGVLVPSEKQARAVKGSAKTYEIRISVEPVASNGLKVKVLCFNHARRSLMGEVAVKASGGARTQLLAVLAPKVMDEAADAFNWMSDQPGEPVMETAARK